MKVSELIELLKAFDPDAVVVAPCVGEALLYPLESISAEFGIIDGDKPVAWASWTRIAPAGTSHA